MDKSKVSNKNKNFFITGLQIVTFSLFTGFGVYYLIYTDNLKFDEEMNKLYSNMTIYCNDLLNSKRT
jgi:hypothetical protein